MLGMRDAATPFAAGVHLPWAEVPDVVREWAAIVGGGLPSRVQDLAGGFSPGAIARLEFDARPDVFVKAVGTELNPDSPGMHRREGVVSALLPSSPLLPRLIGTFDDGQWVALAFAVVEGRLPQHPWKDVELDLALRSLEDMHALLTPGPSSEIDSAGVHLGPVFGGWRQLAGDEDTPAELHPWSRRHLNQLADLESGWPAACDGETLLHGDIRSDNMLVTDGGVVFVDWPHAAVGSPVLDLVEWAPTVALEGGPEPEDLLRRHGPSRRAEPEAVTALVAAVAGYLIEHSLRPSPPGLPTLRAFQAAQGAVARAWLERRTGWS
jgi:hypothetical protein